MQQNVCQIVNHEESRINSICFETKCQGNRLCCLYCLKKFHNNHLDQLVDIDKMLPYIKIESEQPFIQSQEVIQTLEELQQVQTLLDGISKLNKAEMNKLNQLNQQNVWQDILEKLTNTQNEVEIQELQNQQWNQLADDILKHFKVVNSQIVLKGPETTVLSSDYLSQFKQKMSQIQNKLKMVDERNQQYGKNNQFKDLLEKQLLTGHTDLILGVDVCQERNLLVTGSSDNTVRLWDLEKSAQIQKHTCSASVYAVAFSNEGNLLSFGGRGNSVSLIDICDLKKEKQVFVPYSHQNCVNRLRFSNDSKYLISCSDDKKIIVWDILQKKEFYRLNIDSSICGLAINRNDSLIGSNLNDGKIMLWNFQNQKLLCFFKAHEKGVGISFSNDNEMMVSSDRDGLIKLWSLQKLNQGKLELMREFKAAAKWIWIVLFTPCSEFIISFSNQDREIKIINSQTGQVVKLFKQKSSNTCNAIGLAISKNMEILAYGEENNVVVCRKK